MSDHTHTADCYTTELICGNADPEHKHSSSCYSQVGPQCGHQP